MVPWLIVALAAAGCAADARPTRPGVLVAAIENDPGSLNPAITTNGGVHTAAALLFNGLVGLDEDQRPIPELARTWDIEEDGALYRFHLRPGVRWHDGRPFTADDVVFTFDALLLEFHSRTRASLRDVLESVTAVDDTTVEFRFRQPYAPLLQQLNSIEAPILPRHVYGSGDPLRNSANRAPVGTGPFRFVSYSADAEIRYARNEDYFAGAPPLETVIIRVIPDPGTQVLALESGAVDWLYAVPAAHRQRLEARPFIRLRRTPVNPGGSNCINTLAFNLERPALAPAAMRRAIAHAIDRDMLLERVHFGVGTVAAAPISSRIAYAHDPGMALPTHDPTRASALLDSLGWRRTPDGTRTDPAGQPAVLSLKVMPSMAAYGDLIRGQLREIGMAIRIELLEQAVFVRTIFERRDFDMTIVSYCNGTDPQIGVRRQYDSRSIGPVPFSNAAGYASPRMDSLFQRAGAELDPGARRALYSAIQRTAAAELPYFWLIETVGMQAYHTRCRDIAPGIHYAATARCE